MKGSNGTNRILYHDIVAETITEPLWSVLETRVRNRFPPPTSLKQLEDILQEEWYKIPLETVQNLYESILRSLAAVLKAKVVLRHINKEMCTVSVVFPLFCRTHIHHVYTHNR
jgi:hypothetical protein